jgi:hypothetical protein
VRAITRGSWAVNASVTSTVAPGAAAVGSGSRSTVSSGPW